MGRPTLRWLLVLSLALNAFLGVIVWQHAMMRHPRATDMQHIAHNLVPGLSDADRAIVEQAFARLHGGGDSMKSLHVAMEDGIRAALRAEPFDPDALRDALKKTREMRDMADDAFIGSFVEAATKMSAEGRQKLAAGHGMGMGIMPMHGPHPHMPPPPAAENQQK